VLLLHACSAIVDDGMAFTSILHRAGHVMQRPNVDPFPCAQCTTVEGVDVDVSVNGDRGIRAAHFLIEQQAKRPALRPLILLIKAVLKVLITFPSASPWSRQHAPMCKGQHCYPCHAYFLMEG
jgi:hypothetical protein